MGRLTILGINTIFKNVTNIQIVTYPYLARLSENVLEVFHKDIAHFAVTKKWIFFYFPFLGPIATSHT